MRRVSDSEFWVENLMTILRLRPGKPIFLFFSNLKGFWRDFRQCRLFQARNQEDNSLSQNSTIYVMLTCIYKQYLLHENREMVAYS